MSQRRMGYKAPMIDPDLTKGSEPAEKPRFPSSPTVRRQRLFRRLYPLGNGLAAVIVALALVATAVTPAKASGDATAAILTLRDQDAAVLRVGERLAVNNSVLCGNSGFSAGMTIQQLSQYGAAYRAAAQAVLRVTNRPTVTLVAADGAAERAGIMPGDVIAAVDYHVFEDIAPSRASAAFDDARSAQDAVDAALAKGVATLSLIREKHPLQMALKPRPACRARFDVRAGRSNNASSDGLYVQVSSDLVGQAQGDGELAAILAHELAHNILEHPQQLRAKDRKMSVRSTEVAADRLSVYLLDGAGYATADAVAFWSRWGRANDLGILSDRSHPGWKKRIATIQAEAAAIASARAAGQAVAPPADLLPRVRSAGTSGAHPPAPPR